MAKPATRFICAECGAAHSKWSGRCDGCGAWNSISEEVPLSAGPSKKSLGGIRGKKVPLGDLASEDAPPPARRPPRSAGPSPRSGTHPP